MRERKKPSTLVVKLCNHNLAHFLPRLYLQFITSLCIMLANKMEFMVKNLLRTMCTASKLHYGWKMFYQNIYHIGILFTLQNFHIKMKFIQCHMMWKFFAHIQSDKKLQFCYLLPPSWKNKAKADWKLLFSTWLNYAICMHEWNSINVHRRNSWLTFFFQKYLNQNFMAINCEVLNQQNSILRN